MEQEIIELIEERFSEECNKETELYDILDSLDKIELISECEAKYSIFIPNDAIDDIKTVNDLIEICKTLTYGRKRP